MQNNFSQFTNLYEISKTLRFELKPVGKTLNLLEQNHVFRKDKVIKEAYDKIKPFLDKMHRQFINESLGNLKLDFSLAYEKFLEFEKTKGKKQKTEFEQVKKDLRKQIASSFKKTGETWKKIFEKEYKDEKGKTQKVKIKGDSYKILLSETNLNILYELFPEEIYSDEVLVEDYEGKKQNIFKIFKGFTTYFTNFNHSRENFYLDDGKSGRIATRIIDENMIFFFKNKKNFDKSYKDNENLKTKLQEVLDNYGENINDFFNLDFYNKCFLGKDYNQLIGELNLIINGEKQAQSSAYIQAKKENREINFNKNNFPIFKLLYKQILSEKEENNIDEIEDFNDFKNKLNNFISENNKRLDNGKKLVKSLIEKYDEYDFSKIFITKRPALHTLSAKIFGPSNWGLIEKFLLDQIGKKNSNQKLDLPDFIDLENIKIALDKAQKENEEDIFKNDFNHISINDNFLKFLHIFEDEFFNIVSKYEKNLEIVEKDILNLEKFSNDDKKKEKQIEIIKNYLDEALNIYRMIKYFALEKGKENKETEYEIEDDFYNEFKKFYLENEIIKYYNIFRNYLTKKPYNLDKIKLNFENGTLLDGWDKNKEPDNFGTLLKKDGKFYLVLQVYGKKNIFYKKKGNSVIELEEAFKFNTGEDFFEKVDYKFLPDPKKMLPKVCFAKSNLQLFNPSDEILRIKKEETFKTGNSFNKKDFEKIVDYYKECLKKYSDWQVFDFNFSETSEYENLSDFYKEVEAGSYKLNFKKVSKNYIFQNILDGNIYFFEIYNKDFSEGKKGKENLHTMYFKGLFEEENLKNIVLKLNGQAEIFRREASLKERKKIITKKNNKELPENIFHKKRYAENKLFFHCPIKLNFAKDDKKIDEKIRNYISENKEINIIGIDRGEKHLAYYTVINQNGEIIKDENGELVRGSFNEIGGKNYYEELVKREKERQEARGSWKTIGTIKELKEGYISQVVHKLAELIIKYNAIIVFEDLNSGFKRGRQKIERQVYQKFEKALIEKLNYLTFKNRNFGENGHYLKAYQLTDQFTTFEKIGKQTGVIFYTNPSYTSQTCPKCGFRKKLYLKYTNLKNAKKDLEKVNKFYFDGNEFIFEIDDLKIHTFRDRKRNISSEESGVKGWKTIDNNIIENLKNILEEKNINYKSRDNLIEKIIEKNDKELYKQIFYNFNEITKIRNSIIGDNSRAGDFISCPVCDFDSRTDIEIGVESGDANGAYNIARKGIIILDKINKIKKEKGDLSKIKWKDLFVSMDDWDEFVERKF